MSEEGQKPEKCYIIGCDEEATKELDSSLIPALQSLKLRLKTRKRPVKVCKKHYSMIKKASKALR